MNNMKKTILKNVAKAAYKTAMVEANTTCTFFCYQPVVPDKVKDLKKLNKRNR